MKNKRGALGLALLFGAMIFVLGVFFIPAVKDVVTDFRTNIQCTNTSITDGAKVLCLGGDAVVPYFLILILSIGGGLIANEL